MTESSTVNIKVHVDMEKCIIALQKKMEDESGKKLTKVDISQVIADLFVGKVINIEVTESKQRKKPCTKIAVF